MKITQHLRKNGKGRKEGGKKRRKEGKDRGRKGKKKDYFFHFRENYLLIIIK